MKTDLAFTELVNFYHTYCLLDGDYGTGQDLRTAELRYWLETGIYFDNDMVMPTNWKGCALDGFAPTTARMKSRAH